MSPRGIPSHDSTRNEAWHRLLRSLATAGHDQIYTAYLHFLTTLQRDWSVRTENPHEANMFYIPSLLRLYLDYDGHLQRIVDYVRSAYPFYNRTAGALRCFNAGCLTNTSAIAELLVLV